MNAPTPKPSAAVCAIPHADAVSLNKRAWAIVTNDTYTMTPADFRNCVVVSDVASGREYVVGETWTGLHTRTAINVPLCKGCDDPIPADGVCSSCEVIHADIADASGIGDPLKRRAA